MFQLEIKSELQPIYKAQIITNEQSDYINNVFPYAVFMCSSMGPVGDTLEVCPQLSAHLIL